jgi:steroid delta-isomerase-like uncharacterized protein
MGASRPVLESLEPQQGATEAQERNRRAVFRVLKDLWEKGDMSVADEVFAPDFIRHDPHNPVVVGPEGNKDLARKLRSAFPDLRVDVHDCAACDNKVVFHAVVHGTHTGTFADIPPTNARIRVENFGISHFNEAGLSTDTWVCTDYLGLIRQIVSAMSFWQKLINIRHIWRAEDIGRYASFGKPGGVKQLMPPSWPRGAHMAPPVHTTLPPQSGVTDAQERNRKLVFRVLKEFWEQGDMALADSTFTKDFVRHDPHNPDVEGPEGYKNLVKKLRTAFPDLLVDIHDISAFESRCIFHATVRGTHLGRFAGIPPTKCSFSLENMTIVDFNEDGTCPQGWVITDYLGLIRQLIKALTFWQVLFNIHHIVRSEDFGRSIKAPFGEAAPPKQITAPSTRSG